ncbi:Oxidoreductase htatip2 [Tieghemiomyces parasiticus]|uniref:Oxidoreductase htatip2 n=1 Tax=Tieghemiomyces parasiticus TaxID=78921 RepID=A0A9W7ZRR6_9FUNG|nr:Oxidoreductase htatip2 [Tieghemiomyces parasiticus]
MSTSIDTSGSTGALVANLESFRAAYATAQRPARALIVGATGEVGQEVLRSLLSSGAFEQVTSLGRRELPADIVNTAEVPSQTQFEHRVVDFDHLDRHTAAFKGHTHGFCCLGTTRAKSGAEGFRRVDHDYVIGFAEQFLQANQSGAEPLKKPEVLATTGSHPTAAAGDLPSNNLYFALVSSMGADSTAFFLYPKTKGQVEEKLKSFGFGRLAIFQPGLLMCDRHESRFVESVVIKSVRALGHIVSTRRFAIPTPLLGQAIVGDALCHPVATKSPTPQVVVLQNNAIMDSLE